MDETEFNGRMRVIFRSQGLNVLHIREADVPGPADLIVWRGRELLAWVELKVDEEEVRISQIEFLRDRRAEADNAYVFRYMNRSQLIRVYRPQVVEASSAWKPLAVVPMTIDWPKHLEAWNTWAKVFVGT